MKHPKVKYIDYHCKKCGYLKEATNWQVIKSTAMKATLFVYIGLTVFLLAMVLISPHKFTKYGDGIVPILFAYRLSIPHYDEELRSIAVDMVKDCPMNDHNCIKYTIYDKLKDIDYNEASVMYNPVNVIKDYNGDCKLYSYTVVQLLNQLDEESHVKCNSCHCWVNTEWRGLNVSIDLTRKFFGENSYQNKYVEHLCDKYETGK